MYCVTQVVQFGKLAPSLMPSMLRPLATSLYPTSQRRLRTPQSGMWRITVHFGATDLAQAATRRQQKRALTSTRQYLVVKNQDLNLAVRQVGQRCEHGRSMCCTVYIHLYMYMYVRCIYCSCLCPRQLHVQVSTSHSYVYMCTSHRANVVITSPKVVQFDQSGS